LAPLEFVLTGLEAQPHRRSIKTHLSADGLPIDPRVKYVYMGRHPLDVFMSLWNHHSNYADDVMLLSAPNTHRAEGLFEDAFDQVAHTIR